MGFSYRAKAARVRQEYVLFWTYVNVTWKQQIPPGETKTGPLVIDKDDKHPMKGDMPSNDIPVQSWHYWIRHSTHFTVYSVVVVDKQEYYYQCIGDYA